jgi:hypothetical protein
MVELPARFPDAIIANLKTLAPRWASFGYFARIRAISEIYNECSSQGGASDVFFRKLKEILKQDITDIRTAVEIYVKDGIKAFIEGDADSASVGAGAQVLATRATIAGVGHASEIPDSDKRKSSIVTIPRTTFKKLRALAEKWDSFETTKRPEILEILKIIAPIYDAFIEKDRSKKGISKKGRSKDEFVDIAAEILKRSQDGINLILAPYCQFGKDAFDPAFYGKE